MSDWLNAITQVRREGVEKPAKGFMTSKEIAALEGISTRSAREHVCELIRLNRVETKRYKIQRSDGTMVSVPHYRLKKRQ